MKSLLLPMLLLIAGLTAAGDSPLVHSLFTDHMVLPREVECPVWGWATPGETVTVAFAGQSTTATAREDGRWEIRLEPLPANDQPQTLTVQSDNAETVIEDVLVGDVWLCSGQSNMSFGINGANQWWNELPSTPVEDIRLFWVQPTSSMTPRKTVVGTWSVASQNELLHKKQPFTSVGFSAIAWFYARALHRETGLPVGVIECAQGNTAIQPWSTLPCLRRSPKYPEDLTTLSGYETMLTDWAARSDPDWETARNWIAPDCDDSEWDTAELPATLTETKLAGFQGFVWFRRDLELGGNQRGADLTLNLGPLKDQTAVWINGHFVGGHDGTCRVVGGGQREHTFTIPADALHKEPNTIVVRVFGKHGLKGPADRMFLRAAGEETPLSLAGPWKYRAGTPTAELTGRRRQPDRYWAPAGLYHGMVAPLTPFPIKGTIWYQGEGNAGQASYGDELTAMIRSWRAAFEVGDFPFYIVQLAGFRPYPADPPATSGWAITRELQAQVARTATNSGLAVAIDRGEIYDIHPPNKRDVGERLAALALNRTYGKDVPCEGPTFREMSIEGDRVRIRFDHAEGLKSVGGAPSAFAIAGGDSEWVWAQAMIDGNSVVVWSPQIATPMAVRYGWAENAHCNLYNAADLPAVPFRTDGQ